MPEATLLKQWKQRPGFAPVQDAQAFPRSEGIQLHQDAFHGFGRSQATDVQHADGAHLPRASLRICTRTRSAPEPVESVKSSNMGTSAFMLGMWKSLATGVAQ